MKRIMEARAARAVEVTEKLDFSKVTNIEMGGIDTRDYPEFCDAYIESGLYDGKEMTEEQLEELNNSDFCPNVYEYLSSKI